MTRFQKVCCVLLSMLFLAVLYTIPDPEWIAGNLYRQLPFYCFLENRVEKYPLSEDRQISDLIIEGNAKYLSEQVMSEAVTAAVEEEIPLAGNKTKVLQQTELLQEIQPHPVLDLSAELLAEPEYLLRNFFIVDSATNASAANLNAEEFLGKDLSIEKNSSKPQILIYHSHSQEAFADSREGHVEDTIVGVGKYLAKLLRKRYGYKVIHVTEAFDMAGGTLDRNAAYDYARAHIEKILKKHPTIEVVIDLHRDGVEENRHLVTTINGKETAQIMFYNGLSYTNSYGPVDYLPNPYIQDNLAFSFQLEYQAALFYPELYRGIYLAGLRYNLHLKPRALLLEAGAQTNTVQEVKNAMEPFADILNRVLTKEEKQENSAGIS